MGGKPNPGTSADKRLTRNKPKTAAKMTAPEQKPAAKKSGTAKSRKK